jgi:hypothetical protein
MSLLHVSASTKSSLLRLCTTSIMMVSIRKEYQEYFLRGKGGRCVGLTNLPLSCADGLEAWEPQPAGTFRSCLDLSSDCFGKVYGGHPVTCYWSYLRHSVGIAPLMLNSGARRLLVFKDVSLSKVRHGIEHSESIKRPKQLAVIINRYVSDIDIVTGLRCGKSGDRIPV